MLKLEFNIGVFILLFGIFLFHSPNIYAETKLYNTKKTSNSSSNVYVPEHKRPEEQVVKELPAHPDSKVTEQKLNEYEELHEQKMKEVDDVTIFHTKKVIKACQGHWEKQHCMSELADFSMTLTVTYADQLDKADKREYLDMLKEHCAASTAAREVDVPAYAMSSAMTECANIMVDINEATDVYPDPNLYQLAVGSIMCLNKNLACFLIEQQLLVQARKN